MDVINNTIDYGAAISEIAVAIEAGNLDRARAVARTMPKRIKKKTVQNAEYSTSSGNNTEARKYSYRDLMKVFVRDGFIDRYTGLRLVIPPALRMISHVILDTFPYHPNWAEGKCHDAYWDLSATADHVKPVADEGSDDENNLVSTSMATNLQKNSISLEALGWELYPAGKASDWDGLSHFFIRQCDTHPDVLDTRYFKQWYQAVSDVM